jgi:hypothetical protein
MKSIKKILKYILKVTGLLNRWYNLRRICYKKTTASKEQMLQTMIKNQYRLMAISAPDTLPHFSDTGFKVYSQFDEDGILLYIFSIIGFSNRKVIEVCGGVGWENNTANLIINHACEGLLFDGNEENIMQAKTFFKNHDATWICPPICKKAWITKDNINQLIEEEGFNGNIDLFSLDVDGNDYYFWDALSIVSPRVFICEVHNVIPDEMSITIPYQEDFFYRSGKQHIEFRSVSPLAMIRLSKRKGYRLVAAHKYGFNLIFMRNDVGKDFFPEITLSEVQNNPYTLMRKKTAWDAVKNAPWVEVEKDTIENDNENNR